jgi:hypothetical protein
VEQGKLDKSHKVLEDAYRSLPSSDRGLRNLLVSSVLILQRKGLIPTGLKELDDIFRGGIGVGELAVVMACTSGGKTSFLVYLACHAAKLGHSVYFVSLEESEVDIEMKMRNCFCGIENPGKVVWGKMQRKLDKNKGCFYIRQESPYSLSVEEIERGIPDGTQVLFVDYADYLLGPSGNASQGYSDLGLIYGYLKRLGVDKKIPVWTASQVNRPAYVKTTLSVDDVEASLRKMMVCRQVVTLNQTEVDRVVDPETGNCQAVLHVAKNAYGPRFDNLDLTINWATVGFQVGRMA